MKKVNVRGLVVMAMLAAVSIVLTRLLVIYITNSIRISFGNIPIMLAGFWFGPIWGLVVGFVTDFVGATCLSGLGWYAPMSLSPMMMGCIAGLIGMIMRRKQMTGLPWWLLLTYLCNIPATMLWTTYCLSGMYGTPFTTLLLVRGPLYVCIALGEALILFGLFRIKLVSEFDSRLLR